MSETGSTRSDGETVSNPEITANFNDKVLVRITPRGEEVWNTHYTGIRAEYPDAYPIVRDEEGYTTMQLWEVAHVFGAAMYNGATPPIEMTFKLVPSNL